MINLDEVAAEHYESTSSTNAEDASFSPVVNDSSTSEEAEVHPFSADQTSLEMLEEQVPCEM